MCWQWKSLSHVWLSTTPWTVLYSPWNSPGQNTRVGRLLLLQEIFPIQGSNPDLPHCRWILYQLNHQGSPRILEWVAYLFSGGSSQPRNWTRSPALQVNSLPTELSGKHLHQYICRFKWKVFLKKILFSSLSLSMQQKQNSGSAGKESACRRP